MTDLPAHPHDAIVNLSNAELEMLAQVQAVVEEAEDQRNPQIAFRFGKGLRRSRQVQGYALAMLFYEMRQRWGLAFESDDDFVDVAAAEFAYSVETINKYLKTWEWCFVKPNHPDARRRRLLGHDLDTTYRLAAASKEGQMTDEMWEEAAMAPNKEAVMELREKIRGSKTSSNSTLRIMLDRDGTLLARRGNKPYRTVGALNTNLESDDEIIAASIERIVGRSGIFRR